jgi:hypothetical protein
VSRVRALAGTRKGAFVLTSDGKREDCRLRVYRSRTAGDDWEPLTRGLPRQHCYVNVMRDAVAIDTLDNCGVYFGTTGGQVYASGDTWAPIVRDLPAVLSVEATQLYFFDGRLRRPRKLARVNIHLLSTCNTLPSCRQERRQDLLRA